MAVILRIAIPTPLRRKFDYLLPASLDKSLLKPGIRIQVPFGRREIIGILLEIVGQSDIPNSKLKPIIAILDEEPVLDASMLKLCQWGSDYYHYSIGEVLFYALPRLLRQGGTANFQTSRYWRLCEEAKSYDVSLLKRAPRQAELLKFLLQKDNDVQQAEITALGFASSAIQALHRKGLIVCVEKENNSNIKNQSLVNKDRLQQKLNLNAAQQEAVTKISQKFAEFQCFLLHGVTGSGKTEVYLHIIEDILRRGQQALVLVPEISLTPQTVNRFAKRFPVPIVTIHSGLNDRERLDAWLLAKAGTAKIIIGTRSAIFTPCSNPGIIIIDEEHDLSFKQQEGFRYSARDLAIMRAKMLEIPIILGSATPSFEALYNVEAQRYTKLHLPERAGNAVHPKFRIIDICDKRLQHGLSRELLNAIGMHLQQENQVLIFLNRRGYAPALMCHRCGWIAKCNRCDVNMTLHSQPVYLHCHHCDSRRAIYRECPNCQYRSLRNMGVGTEQLELALSKYFADVPVIRIDRDTTRHKNALDNLLNSFQQGDKQILIGTQMIAKGHHFPNVTLVGVINIDSGFFSADFRTTERVGQLLIQVAGRAGRAEKEGEVLIQTHHPEHPLLLTLIRKGYEGFAQVALRERLESQMPPYAYFALFRAEALKENLANNYLQSVKELISDLKRDDVDVLGPIPSTMPRRKGYHRLQLLLQSLNRTSLQKLLNEVMPGIAELKLAKKVKWSIDVDPLEMY